MPKLSELSLTNMLKEYSNNKGIINAYLSRKQGKVVEGYGENTTDAAVVMGMSVGIFFILLLAVLALYVWLFVAFFKNYKTMPMWAIIAFWAILLFIPGGGPVFGLVLIYSTKDLGRDGGKLGIY